MRMTRAALRAQAPDDTPFIHEDSEPAPEMHLPQSDEAPRPVLKDITDENFPNFEGSVAEEDLSTKKMRGKKKGKSAKKDEPRQAETLEQGAPRLQGCHVNDSTPSVGTPNNIADSAQYLSVPNAAQNTIPATLAQTRFSATPPELCQTPFRDVTAISKTPKFDPEIHVPLSDPIDASEDIQEDSFVASIKSRSPSKLDNRSPMQEASQESLIEPVKTITPAKASPRIEDSVEAIDALEDAIEKIAETMPTLENIAIESPVKTRKQSPSKSIPPSARKTALDTTIATKTPKPLKTPPTKTKVSASRPAPPKTVSGRISTVKPTTKAPFISKSQSRTTTVVSKPTTTASKPDLSLSKSPAKQQSNVVKKRVPSAGLSTSKPGFVPAKSSKAVTKSDFTLPGEAISAKLKAQREERLKREEEAERLKTVFKARPAPPRMSRPSVVPRMTKTTSARLSLMTSGSDKENEAPKPKVVASKASPNLSVAKARQDLNKANSSVRRMTVDNKTKATPRASVGPRVSSLVRGQKSVVTKVDSANQKVRGKEVFGRTKTDIEKTEKDRKEKEEAAKRARMEAAERGRQASREWAEKQKKKQLASKAKESPAATTAVMAF